MLYKQPTCAFLKENGRGISLIYRVYLNENTIENYNIRYTLYTNYYIQNIFKSCQV